LEGFVSYTVRLRPTAKDGDVVTAQASIVFDTNDPILTPVWSNTVGTPPPDGGDLPPETTAGSAETDPTGGWSDLWEHTRPLAVGAGLGAEAAGAAPALSRGMAAQTRTEREGRWELFDLGHTVAPAQTPGPQSRPGSQRFLDRDQFVGQVDELMAVYVGPADRRPAVGSSTFSMLNGSSFSDAELGTDLVPLTPLLSE
jgi:hypothetical protein